MDDKIKEFAEELRLLLDKYNAKLGGCGCCGSPYLEMEGNTYIDDLQGDGEKVTFTSKGGQVTVP